MWKTKTFKVDVIQLSPLSVNSSGPFQVPILTLPSQGFGLSQHILQKLAVKSTYMETEREFLVPEIYLMKSRTKALIFSLEWTLFNEN